MKEVLPHSLTEKHRATYARNVIAEPKVFQPTLLRPGRAKKNTLPCVKRQRGDKEKCSLKPTQSKPEALTRAGNGVPRFNQSATLRVKSAKQFKPTSTLLEVGLTTRPKGGRHTKTSKKRPTVQKNCFSRYRAPYTRTCCVVSLGPWGPACPAMRFPPPPPLWRPQPRSMAI